ncbi:MAG: glucosamine-6-phosphate deaminase [Ginsengibacter sp.]
MELFVYDNYETMSAEAAKKVMQLIDLKKDAVFCTASGDSPKGLYKEFVEQIQKNKTDISNLNFIGLDEWLGMNGGDEGSCRFHLDNQLFRPLKINKNKISFFDGRAHFPEQECERVDKTILSLNGIDLAIVGLGMNGHVGMNEPGTSSSLHSHVAKIDPITQQVGQKYFKERKEIPGGLTLGIANLMEAKNVMLVVNDSRKAGILKQVLEEEISEKFPASFLRNHPNFSVYADSDATRLLKNKDKNHH